MNNRPQSGMLLRARMVLPIAGPVIEDGVVEISGRRVLGVGRWRDQGGRDRRRAVDLGAVILMPGLINAHCHLDYTHMAGQFRPPRVFTDWLKQITETKAGWSLEDYAASWRDGAAMLLRTGTTTVADIEAVPQLLPEVWATPLRVFSLLEMIGMTSRRTAKDILDEALTMAPQLPHPRSCSGLSPHAPYSALPELLRLTADAAQHRHWLVSTHVAESALEFTMFSRARGEMYRWLQRSGRDMSDCDGRTPVRHLAQCGLLGPQLLAAHLNYLGHGDIALLARHKVTVVHCPRSHAYFGHRPFSRRRLARAGVNLCLGTDSLASVCRHPRRALELNLFEEMRALADREKSLSPRTVVRMATINGARALGRPGQLGQLSKHALADAIALPWTGKTGRVYDAILAHQGPVAASLIDGQWAIQPEGIPS